VGIFGIFRADDFELQVVESRERLREQRAETQSEEIRAFSAIILS
jgi:hypothetical protein